MRIDIPQDAENIINILNNNGFEAYVVGGCVRDSILGREPEDWDVTTSAKPEDVKRIFNKTIDTGIQHGTVTVRMHGCSYEITTYRIDGEYEDNRHPKNVIFTSKLSEDLLRRDFTINAMAYNMKAGLVDMYGGIEDLNNKIIRCVGDAEARFKEDALRTLRAIRFAGQLDFRIESETYAAIKSHAGNVAGISAERIRDEITKLIMSDGVDRLEMLNDTGLSDVFFPELGAMFDTPQNNPHHKYTVGGHTIKAIENIHALYKGSDMRDYKLLCWSALLHDVGKPVCRKTDEDGIDHFYGHPKIGVSMAENILKRLRHDNYTIGMIKRLIEYHDCRLNGSEKAMRRFVSKAGKDMIPLLFVLMQADLNAQSDYMRDTKMNNLMGAKDTFDRLLMKDAAFTVKDLKVNGKDLMNIGIPSGTELGRVLKELLEEVLEEPSLNDKNTLIEMAKNIFEKI